ncbi:MAG: lysozyme inhibitor LprI family protein [Pseudomonadota bacterium]
MNKYATITAILITTASMAWTMSAQAFDCRRAHNTAEHTVCGSSALRYLDEQLNSEYRYAKFYARSSWSKRRLVRSQRRWLRKRNRCGRSWSCLHRIYTRRLAFLENTYQNGN